ncbi:MAG: T9SS C-terminal target domain-containing protein [Cytophagales bacterium]|nr:MAG: T9SS C-terminal target domain-containing protein [Cytophagales bacterium]
MFINPSKKTIYLPKSFIYFKPKNLHLSLESNFETSNNNVNFQLKPNPNKGSFTVNSTIESTYFITDLLGKELAKGQLQIGENQIETSLISGIYVFIFSNNRLKMVVE